MKHSVALYLNVAHQIEWREAAIAGFKRHGLAPVVASYARPVNCDLVVLWGTRRKEILQKQKAIGGRALIFERGYFSDRYVRTSVGYDNLNGRANFYNKGMNSSRWELYGGELKKWRTGGEEVVIAGQVQGDMSCSGIILKSLYTNIVKELREIGVENVTFKPHPLARVNSGPDGVRVTDNISKASCVVSYNSNFAVDCVIGGVPVITLDKGSMAWDVSGHSLKDVFNLKYPDRRQWAYDLAYTQWLKTEIANGDMWDHLKQGMESRMGNVL